MDDWDYADLVLLAAATPLSLGVGVGALTGVSLSLSVSVASLVAAVPIGHGLFVNTPDDVSE